MHITLRDAEKSVHIGPCQTLVACLPTPPYTSAQLSWAAFDGEWDARQFVQRYFLDAGAMARLRGALAADLYPLTRWHDEEVLSAAARRLARGQWRVAYEELAGPPPIRSSLPARREAPPPADAMERRPQRMPRMSGAREEQPAEVPTPAPVEWSTSAADQVAQAGTLVTAARDGTPFCAICEAMRKAKLEAQHA